MRPTPATPDAEALERLPADDWAWLLSHLRAALHALDDAEVTPVVERLRAAPPSRLAGGRTRRDAARLVARGGALWRDLHERIADAGDRPPGLDPLVAGEPVVVTTPPTPGTAAGPTDADRDTTRQAELDRLRSRARELKRARDEARRQLEGAEVRAAAAEERAAEAERRLAELESAEAAAQEAVAAADAERSRAIERERRRSAADRRALEDELTEVRRELHELRAEAQRSLAKPPAAPPRPAAAARADDVRADPGVVVGRPTRLPPRVRAGTREAAEALLGRGRLVYVDGYNLTRTQRDDLDLAGQRHWLVQSLATLAARTGIEPTVWFDSTVAGSSGRQERARGVRVRYTAHGLSADDELVFAVEALERDRPVVVVTDDRELRSRLAPYRVDLLDTASFRWMLG